MTSPLPTPTEVRAEFARRFDRNPESATDYLYQLGVSCGYIKLAALEHNICWTTPSPWGNLELTINYSKPEKDPRAIAAAAVFSPDFLPPNGIPQCDLCWENEEFPGSPSHPVKPGLRIAAITLGGEHWGLQFSPYSYYPEHCIALSAAHRPMTIDDAAIGRLLDFVDLFPFYFIGSNADLPIVGGSILSHDHFQGGRHVFPLMKAPIRQQVELPGFPAVQAGIVDWPSSTLRLASKDRRALQQAAALILDTWRSFSFPEAGIIAYGNPTPQVATKTEPTCPAKQKRENQPGNCEQERSDTVAIATSGERHNTLNPIVAKDASAGTYTMHLVLRNNRTDTAHPWGIFHPTENLHHIKKENIGLIEIMGRAILPGRLANELPQVQYILTSCAASNARAEDVCAQLQADPLAAPHAEWGTDVYQRRFLGDSSTSALRAFAQNDEPRTAPPLQSFDQDDAAHTAPPLRISIRNDGPSRPPRPAPCHSEPLPCHSERNEESTSAPLAPWMEAEVGRVFAQVLECTGVFKNDETGNAGWQAFLQQVSKAACLMQKEQS